jgi:hypothetical protein
MDYTYSLGVVIKYLESKSITYKIVSGRVGASLYEHGCRMNITDDLSMSIQTHPAIAGPAFAETAIRSDKEKSIVYKYFGYGCEVIRHDNPEDLFNHIEAVLNEAKTLENPDNE